MPPNNSVENSKANVRFAIIGCQAAGEEQAKHIIEMSTAKKGTKAMCNGDLFEEDYVLIENELEGSAWTVVWKNGSGLVLIDWEA